MIVTEYMTEKGINPAGSMYTQIYGKGKTSKIAKNNLLSKKSFTIGGNSIEYANIYNVSNMYDRNSYKLLEKITIIEV